jgi:CotH kinase protein
MRILLILCLQLLVSSLFAQTFTSSNLPIVLIKTNGLAISDEPKITADMSLVYNGPGQRNLVGGPFNDYDGKIGIEYRGSTSQDLYAKKGYSIELRKADGNDRSESLIGMPKESDWVLIGPYNDKSLMRDALALHLAGQIMDYAPRAQLVEVVLNGGYQGVYLLAEKVKRDDDRVAVAKNTPADITGGYIIKMDKFTGATNGSWQSSYKPTGATFQGTDFLFHYPSADIMTNPQRTYIRNWFQDFEDALAGPNYRDTVIGYRKYIDIASFVDYMLVNEAFKNVDALRLSTYCYKNRDSIDTRLHMGPVWDFNIAMGLGDYCNGQNTSGWIWNHHLYCADDTWLVPFWWARLRTDPRYMQESEKRWRDLRGSILSTPRIHATIDSLAALLQESQARNFQKWPVMGVYVWPNAFVGTNYNAEVQFLKSWFATRLDWIDGELPKLSALSVYNPSLKWKPVVFPNPTKHGRFSTRIYAPEQAKVRIRVSNAEGRVVQETSVIAQVAGDQDIEWPPIVAQGIYFYELWVNDQSMGSGKLEVQ